jgi:DNA-binding HxlR family transcriptional regulator
VALYVQFGGENFSVVLDIPGISQKVLTDNLRALESDGLVIRTVYPEIPPRVEYSLSELGNTLRPLFKDMEEWGNSYKEYIKNQTDKN